VLIRGIRGGFNGHEFHEFQENDHCHLDVIGLKYNFSQSLRPGCLTPTFNYARWAILYETFRPRTSNYRAAKRSES